MTATHAPLPDEARHIYAEIFRMCRQELADSVRPHLDGSYPLYVVDMMGETFAHLGDWIEGKPYELPAITGPLAAPAPADPALYPDLDDFDASDGALEAAFEAAAAGGDAGQSAQLVNAVAQHYSALFAAEAARREARRKEHQDQLDRIDWQLTPDLVTRYAAEKLGQPELVAERVVTIPGGHSKDTFLVSFTNGTEWIVRRDFPFGPVDTSAPNEFGLLATLKERGLPVPTPIAAEHDRQWFGQPFLVVSRANGIDGNEAGKADPEIGRIVSLELARLLAELHAIDPRDLGITVADGSAPEQVLAYIREWKAWWHANRLHPNALVTAGFAWLEANVPQEISRVVPIHGDARPGNMLMDGREVGALLDWEFIHAGDPAEDLQYAKGFVEPFVTWEEFSGAYLAAGGAAFSEAGERFYDVFRSLRNVVCTDVAWGGFVQRKYPAFKLAMQGVVYKRMLATALATSLDTLTR